MKFDGVSGAGEPNSKRYTYDDLVKAVGPRNEVIKGIFDEADRNDNPDKVADGFFTPNADNENSWTNLINKAKNALLDDFSKETEKLLQEMKDAELQRLNDAQRDNFSKETEKLLQKMKDVELQLLNKAERESYKQLQQQEDFLTIDLLSNLYDEEKEKYKDELKKVYEDKTLDNDALMSAKSKIMLNAWILNQERATLKELKHDRLFGI